MGKSIKRTPIIKDWNHSTKYRKRQANKKIRRTADIADGKAYRRVTNPWDIYDNVCYCSKQAWLADYEAERNSIISGVFYETTQERAFEDLEKSYGLEGWNRTFYRK